jgi:cell division protein FtsI (penicillin-binding protein 3)
LLDFGSSTRTKTAYLGLLMGKNEMKDEITFLCDCLPFNNPKYAVFVLVDEPKSSKEIEVWGRTAGHNAVPISKIIIMEIAPILGIKKSFNNTEL